MSEAHTAEPLILVVEDDLAVVGTLRQVLTASGFRVSVAESGADARATLEQLEPQLILVDLVLPDADGLVLAATLKTLYSTPIIIMSACVPQAVRVLGFKLGVDDFITKPLDVEELMARVEAVLGGAYPPPQMLPASSDRISVGELTIVPSRAMVRLATSTVHLTPTEYRLLFALATHADEVLSREALLQQVWGYTDRAAGHVVDVQVGRLRKKLRHGSLSAPQIVTVRGGGFKLASVPSPPPEADPDAREAGGPGARRSGLPL